MAVAGAEVVAEVCDSGGLNPPIAIDPMRAGT